MGTILAILLLLVSMGGLLWLLGRKKLIKLPGLTGQPEGLTAPQIKIEALARFGRGRTWFGKMKRAGGKTLLVGREALDLAGRQLVRFWTIMKPPAARVGQETLITARRLSQQVLRALTVFLGRVRRLPADYRTWQKEIRAEGERRRRFFSNLLKQEKKPASLIKQKPAAIKGQQPPSGPPAPVKQPTAAVVTREPLRDRDLQEESRQRRQFRSEAWQAIEARLLRQIVDNPKDVAAYKKLGKLYFTQDDYQGARVALKTALQLGAKEERIRRLLTETEKRLKNIKDRPL